MTRVVFPGEPRAGEGGATMHRKFTLAMSLLIAVFTLAPGTAPAHATTTGALSKIPGVRIPIVLAPGNGTITSVGVSPDAPLVARPDVIAQSHIEVNYQGFSTSARTAFQAAVNYWAATLSTPTTITVDAMFGDLGHNQNGNLILGGAGPGEFFRDSPGVPLAHTWYPKALANRFAGFDLDPAHSDIQAVFTSNSAAHWYYGTDDHAPGNMISFESVVMHELGHGLGFVDSFDSSGGLGSFGHLGFPVVYDRLVVNGGGTPLVSFPNPSAALASALVSPIYLHGTKTPKSRAFSPNPFLPGSSVAHLDENTYPRGNPNSLMTPAIAPGENIATAGPIVLAVFKDLGWSVPLGTVLHDATGDRNNDFVARNPDGSLFTYPGNGHGAIMPPFGVSTIFGQFLKIALSADWNGDNVPDIIGKRPDGTWWLLRGTGAGKYSAPVQMGTGGMIFNTWFAPGDFNGDGKSDLIARKSDGTLVMLKGNGAAGFGAPQKVGTGFDQYNLLFSPGDFNGDQKPDVLARTTAGKLMFFAGDGTGHLAPGVQITSPVDWNTLTMLFSPGDFNGDGKSDLIGRKSDGTLWMYRGNGAGGLIGNNQIGSGFNSFNLMR